MMTKAEAVRTIKAEMKNRHPGIKGLKVTFVEWGKAEYPTGETGRYGYCAVEATGYIVQGFLFQTYEDGDWKMYTCKKATDKIAKGL